MTIDKIQVELTLDDWIALLVASLYGANTLADLGMLYVAGTVELLVDRLSIGLQINSVSLEGIKLERRLDQRLVSQPPDYNGKHDNIQHD